MDFGKQLKNAREAKDLTLQQVSRELKINLNVLKKIEASEANDLPNATSTKGFLRSYASHIDLNVEPVIEDYLAKLQVNEVEVSDTVLKEAVDPSPFFLSEFIQKKILPVVFLFVVLGIGFVSYRYLNGVNEFFTNSFNFQSKSKVSTPVEVTPKKKVEEVGEEKEIAATDNDKEVKKSLEETSEALATQVNPVKELKEESVKKTSTDVKLIIEPLAQSYAYYKDQNNKSPITLSLKPNTKRSFTFKEAEITFLDSGAVNLILNGKDIGSPGIFAERKTVKFPSLEGL